MCSNRQSGVGRVMAGAAGAKRALDAGESRESVLTAFRAPGVAKGATVSPNPGKRLLASGGRRPLLSTGG